MHEATVDLTFEERIATLRLRRPEAGNALDLRTCTQMADLLESADWSGVDALVLRGEGRAFCVGGDLREMVAAADRSAYLRDLAGAAHRAIRELARAPMPVVSVVDGAAAGAGLALALISDLVLVGDSARFLVAYPQVGLTPDCGTSWMLPRVVGRRVAARLSYLSETVDADGAVTLGIASHRVPTAELESTLAAIADELHESSREAVAGTKALMADAGGLSSFFDHLEREQESIAAIAASADTAGRIDTFLRRSAATPPPPSAATHSPSI